LIDINLQLVREFFELNRFRVLTNWNREFGGGGRSDHGAQLFVENGGPVAEGELHTLLHPSGLSRIQRAVVEIRAWHTDRFYASTIESNPVVTEFAEPPSLAAAQAFFGTPEFAHVLVVSEFPVSAHHRAAALAAVSNTEIDCVIEFPSILRDMISRVSTQGGYPGSPTLQLIQTLKRYRLFRDQQMEFDFPLEPPVSADGEVIYRPEEQQETDTE
jgi:hypothetical protein